LGNFDRQQSGANQCLTLNLFVIVAESRFKYTTKHLPAEWKAVRQTLNVAKTVLLADGQKKLKPTVLGMKAK
jgi:hypothetical protein